MSLSSEMCIRDRSKLQDYRSLIREAGYKTRTSPKDLLDDDPNEPPPGDNVSKPYVIKPEEFDTLDNYDAVCYTYYADGVLVDEDEDQMCIRDRCKPERFLLRDRIEGDKSR